MPVRLRKLIGMILLVTLVIVYSLVSVTIATYRLADSSGWVHLAYFGITGLFWIVPAMFIVRWMIGKPEDYENP